jgi:hypothetical protein
LPRKEIKVERYLCPNWKMQLKKNQIILKHKFKEYLNRVSEKKLIVYKWKTIKDNEEGKRRIK